MFEKIKALFHRKNKKHDLMQQRIKQLESRLQEVQWNQQKMDIDISAVERYRPRVWDVAIEEKVDMSRLSEDIAQLAAQSASADHVREQITDLQERAKQRQDALKEDITVIDTEIHDAIETMRDDLIDSFRKEFLALETILTYEIDAIEAKDRWAREDLADRITALRESMEEDLHSLETETIAVLQANTASLENRIDRQSAQLTTLREQLTQRFDTRLTTLQHQVEEEINALPDPSEFPDTWDIDEDELTAQLDDLRAQLEEQHEQIDDARESFESSIETALETLRSKELAPVQTAIKDTRDMINIQVAELDAAVQDELDRLSREETADMMRLEDRIRTLENRVDQEIAASETAQHAALRQARETITTRLDEHDTELTSIHDTITDINDSITGLTTDIDGLQDHIDTLAEADDLEQLRKTVETVQDELGTKATIEQVDSLDVHLEQLRDQIEAIDKEKADRASVQESFAEVEDDISGIRDWIKNIKETLTDRLNVLSSKKADRKPVEEQLATLADSKADAEHVDNQLEGLSDDMRNLRNWLEDARETLVCQLEELEAEAAKADRVEDLKDQLNELEGAAARHEKVRKKLEQIREDITDLRENSLTEDDVSFMRSRIQRISEKLEQHTREPGPFNRPKEGEVENVTREEFEQLQTYIAELSALVLELVNANTATVQVENPIEKER